MMESVHLDLLQKNEMLKEENDVQNDHARTSTWWHSALLVVADVVGTGVLSLPYAFSRLGWVPSLILLAVNLFFGVYSGILLSRMATVFPNASTFGMLGDLFFNRIGALFGYISLYSYLFFLLSEYLLVLGKAMQGIVESRMCLSLASFISSLVLIFPNQFRTLHGISFLSAISFITVFIVLVMCIIELVANPHEGAKSHSFHVQDSWDAFGAACSIIFAFAGHKIYLEIMYEMKDPAEFKKTLYVAYPILFILYITVGAVGYYNYGQETPDFLLNVIDDGPTKQTASFFLFVHMIISYVLNQQVLVRAIQKRFYPDFVNKLHNDGNMSYRQSQLQWAVISVCVLSLCWVIANSIPFFGDFVELLGAMFVTSFVFGFPPLLYIFFQRHVKGTIPTCERFFLYILLATCVVLTLFGTIAAFRDIYKDSNTYGKPFDCHAAE